jgi:hypothetical protein
MQNSGVVHMLVADGISGSSLYKVSIAVLDPCVLFRKIDPTGTPVFRFAAIFAIDCDSVSFLIVVMGILIFAMRHSFDVSLKIGLTIHPERPLSRHLSCRAIR